MDNPASPLTNNESVKQNSPYSGTEQKSAAQSNDPGVSSVKNVQKNEPRSSEIVKESKDNTAS